MSKKSPTAKLPAPNVPISLSKAAEITGVSPQTISRWVFKGISGIKLESTRLGGRRFTTRAALAKFQAALNELDQQ